MATPGDTQAEFPNSAPTVRERAKTENRAEETLIYGGPAHSGETSGKPGDFRGWQVTEQLPTKGAEADIYIVLASGAKRVLKLYRHRLEPKLEILNRITEISQKNSHCFVTFYETGFDEATGRWYELQEYMPNGSLREAAQATKRSEEFISALVPELAEAIHCLHENGIIHCDIKPANVLIRALHPLDLVLTDFGISSLLASDMSQKMTSLKGTPMYWAPEAFSREIGRPCDWWGLGMILLEILAGEHPFEGLSDAQIIHKLTIGNVEIPASIEEGWAMLIKGLLTKDDSRRWGKGEVDRWLAGDRSIPVHYEAPGPSGAAGGVKPFRFEGVEYNDAKSLALAFSRSEAPWRAPVDYLRYLRHWFESNLRFDEAIAIANSAGEIDPAIALFRFVNGNASVPFSFMGHPIDLQNLRGYLERATAKTASGCERQIVDMLYDWRMAQFYDEYARFSGADPMFKALLEFMQSKTMEEQSDYIEAIARPDAFLWPRGTAPANMGEAIGTLSAIGRVPMRRGLYEETDRLYVLPHELRHMIGASESYSSGVRLLELWVSRGLLLPRVSSEDADACANLTVGEYERTARIHCLGHTSETLRQLDSISEALDALPVAHDNFLAPVIRESIDRMDALKDRKVEQRDKIFMVKAGELFGERSGITLGRGKRYAASALVAGASCLLLHLLGGTVGDILLRLAILLSLIAEAIFYFAFIRKERGVALELPGISLIWAYLFLMSGVPFLTFRSLISNNPHAFSFAIGAMPTLIFLFAMDTRKLAENTLKIMDACESYNKTSQGA